MTKRERARKVLEFWMITAKNPQTPISFSADLDAFERAVRDEEAEECALLMLHDDESCGTDFVEGRNCRYRMIRARIAARGKGKK